MADRREQFESAAGTASLGILADDVVLAAIRYQRSRDALTERDVKSLEAATRVLDALRELGGSAFDPAFSAMTTLEGLDEAFTAINVVKPDHEELRAFVVRLREALQAMLDRSADDDATKLVFEVFERLAKITFAKSEELARPVRSG